MAKTRRERCPYCGFLDVIKWGRRDGHQRYKCKNYVKWYLYFRNEDNKKKGK